MGTQLQNNGKFQIDESEWDANKMGTVILQIYYLHLHRKELDSTAYRLKSV